MSPLHVPANGFDPFIASFDLETDGLYVGTNLDTGADVFLSPKTLENIHIQLIPTTPFILDLIITAL